MMKNNKVLVFVRRTSFGNPTHKRISPLSPFEHRQRDVDHQTL